MVYGAIRFRPKDVWFFLMLKKVGPVALCFIHWPLFLFPLCQVPGLLPPFFYGLPRFLQPSSGTPFPNLVTRRLFDCRPCRAALKEAYDVYNFLLEFIPPFPLPFSFFGYHYILLSSSFCCFSSTLLLLERGPFLRNRISFFVRRGSVRSRQVLRPFGCRIERALLFFFFFPCV